MRRNIDPGPLLRIFTSSFLPFYPAILLHFPAFTHIAIRFHSPPRMVDYTLRLLTLEFVPEALDFYLRCKKAVFELAVKGGRRGGIEGC